ncbi:ArpU family phage packaging/lysis transcriptional regulator [Levilactobacillus yiduensis]|uniref:ArpU family phage packaging/lysis transcriptional regulator n=1 Tax=Levilactobacillus yiduensis TaxID=2953880 RepID=UPI000EF352BF|nr:ArpU family phage packaging/lysis transcriptional regulator [Levilactobacillus yiduensis]AYM03132.1 transcriptional regulator [Levilactobacillus brevis]
MAELDFDNMNMGSLFPEVDVGATLQNVTHFLSVVLPKMVRVSGQSMTDLKSPSYDGMPKSQPSGNSTDARIVRRLYAEQIVKQTVVAIKHCGQDSRSILSSLYLQGDTDTMCFMELGFSESSYFHVRKPQALLEFADCYMLDDLHIFEKKQ